MKRIKNIFLSAVLALTAFMPVLAPVAVSAQADIDENLCKGANLDFTNADCTDDGSAATTVNDIVATVINIISLVVGVVAVIMIIIGGLRYVTSGGDSGSVGNAKNTILYAIVGLVVVALAQIIVRFVLERTTSA